MRKTITFAVALAMLGVLGCAGDVAEQGSSLRAVDEQAMTSQLLYMVRELSAIPLTAAQLAELGVDEADAIPVRVEIFDEVAVAWYAPAGEAIISRSSIVALWSVVSRQPIAGEVSSDGEAPVVVGSTPVLVVSTSAITASRSLAVATVEDAPNSYQNPIEQTIIDFFDRVGSPEEFYFLGQLGGYHPGCI